MTPRQISIISLCRTLNVIPPETRGHDALSASLDFVNIVMGFNPPITDIGAITQEQYVAVIQRLKEAVRERSEERDRNKMTVLVDGTEEQRAIHHAKRQAQMDEWREVQKAKGIAPLLGEKNPIWQAEGSAGLKRRKNS